MDGCTVTSPRSVRAAARPLCLLLTLVALLAAGHLVATEVRWDEVTLRQALREEIAFVQGLASTAELVTAAREQNAVALSKAEILRRDLAWSAADGNLPLQQQMQVSETSRYLQRQVEGHRAYSEMILTDAQGVNVAAYPLSSDYWQGDEAKWREVALNKQQSYLSAIAYDSSSDSNVVQLSVPVLDQGDVIGVLIVSIRLSHVLSRQLRDGG